MDASESAPVNERIVPMGWEEALFLDPPELYDPCILGFGRRFHDYFVVYSVNKIIAALAADMEPEEGEDSVNLAREHFEFNVIGGWVGEGTPAFIEDEDELF